MNRNCDRNEQHPKELAPLEEASFGNALDPNHECERDRKQGEGRGTGDVGPGCLKHRGQQISDRGDPGWDP